VTYDRDEWRRAWGPDDTPGRLGTSPDVRPPGPRPPGTGSGPGGCAATGPTDATDARRRAPGAFAGTTTEPLTRYPQPPPDTWDATAAGPGRRPVRSGRPTRSARWTPPRRSPVVAEGLVAVLLAALVGGVIGTGATLAPGCP
jgi:hypothetical protein